MTARARWVFSFADLCLLLLAFFVMLHASRGDAGAVAAAMREAFGGDAGAAADRQELVADHIFEPGEAVLRRDARRRLTALGARSARGTGRLTLSSRGTGRGSSRLDRWELAAARTGAIARALREGGLAEDRLTLSMTPGEASGQRITIRR